MDTHTEKKLIDKMKDQLSQTWSQSVKAKDQQKRTVLLDLYRKQYLIYKRQLEIVEGINEIQSGRKENNENHH